MSRAKVPVKGLRNWTLNLRAKSFFGILLTIVSIFLAINLIVNPTGSTCQGSDLGWLYPSGSSNCTGEECGWKVKKVLAALFLPDTFEHRYRR